mgnify:CR=1 FL=1
MAIERVEQRMAQGQAPGRGLGHQRVQVAGGQRLQQHELSTAGIEQNLQLLIDWLGGSPLAEVGPNS